MDMSRSKPVIFISSTCYDLKQIREDLKDFFEGNYGFQTLLSEFDSFPIDPCIGTFENCLSNVDKVADIFLLIIGTRYGCITSSGKSITNLEYLHAKAKGIPIFVFVDKNLYNNLRIWRLNKSGDFSSIVDTTKIFEFVSEIYDESKQWIYTYESVRDIEMTMKNQLSLIFSDGLAFKKLTASADYKILESNLPANATRVLIEKPFAWEYKFLAYVLKDEFDKLQKRRWDFKYGIYTISSITRNSEELLADISAKLNEVIKLTEIMGTLLNTAFQDALGNPDVPSDLAMIIYVSKQFASLYERMIAWALYFKAIHTDAIFSNLLQLLYEFPKSALAQMDNFVERLYNEITAIPDVNDSLTRKIKLSCILDEANTSEIDAEINRLSSILTK